MTDDNQGFNFDDVSVNDILAQSTEDVDTTEENPTDEPISSQDTSEEEEDTQADANKDQQEQDDPNQNETQDESQEDESEEDSEGDDSETEQEPSVIEELAGLTGFEFEDEEFTEDVKGIADYTKKVGQKIGESYIAEVFEAFPDVQQYLKYRSEGGDPDKYFELSKKTAQYSDLNEESLKADTGLQKSVVKDMFTRMGYSEEDINETIKDLEDSELLLKQSVKFSSRLAAIAQEEKQAELERQQEELQARKEQEKQTWNEINQTISNGNLKGFIVPETDKKSFYDWMTKPIDAKGNTQRSIAMNQMDVESTLALEYLYFKEFDLGKLAKNFKTTSKNNGLRNRLKSNSKTPSPAKAFSKGSRGGNSRAQKLPELKDVL